jgi:hypothetical protein
MAVVYVYEYEGIGDLGGDKRFYETLAPVYGKPLAIHVLTTGGTVTTPAFNANTSYVRIASKATTGAVFYSLNATPPVEATGYYLRDSQDIDQGIISASGVFCTQISITAA